MLNGPENKCRRYQTKFSFGATSAIITNLGIITGLDTLGTPPIEYYLKYISGCLSR